MPTVFRYKNFRFFFFSNDHSEPIHIHVENSDDYAKFWIKPKIILAKSFGFNSIELNSLRKIIETHKNKFEEKWNEHFNRTKT